MTDDLKIRIHAKDVMNSTDETLIQAYISNHKKEVILNLISAKERASKATKGLALLDHHHNWAQNSLPNNSMPKLPHSTTPAQDARENELADYVQTQKRLKKEEAEFSYIKMTPEERNYMAQTNMPQLMRLEGEWIAWHRKNFKE